MGNLIVMALLTVTLIPKAILEVFYFDDRSAAKESVRLWFLLIASLSLAAGFPILVNCFRQVSLNSSYIWILAVSRFINCDI